LGVTEDRLSQNQLKMVYYWQSIDLGSYKQVLVHFTDTENKYLFGNDHPLCEKKSVGELKGKFVKESYVVDIPESARGKVIYVKIGFYSVDVQGWPRLGIESSGGIPIDDVKTRAIVEKVNL